MENVTDVEIIVRKSDRKRSLGRRRHRWQININSYLKETGIEVVNSILLAKDKDQYWILENPVCQGDCQLVKKDSGPCCQVVCTTEKWIDVFCFSGSGGRPGRTGGCPMLVGAVF
jgi:hypothetical protein